MPKTTESKQQEGKDDRKSPSPGGAGGGSAATASATASAGPTYNATFAPRILKQIAYDAFGAAYVIQDIYGMGDAARDSESTGGGGPGSLGGFGGGDEEECVVCLTEPKTTILLPCRHLCVCSECFPQVNQSAKCPVCRAPFETYLQVDPNSQDGGAA